MRKLKKDDSIKIGLYLQTEELKNQKSFNEAMEKIKDQDFDLLVFLEFCYVPFVEKIWDADILEIDNIDMIHDHCLELNRQIKKAVIVNNSNQFGTILSFYANAFADETESETGIYFKHTMTEYSPFDVEDYQSWGINIFQPLY